MGPYGTNAAGNGWCGGGDFVGAPCAAPDIDNLLAEAGYRVRSSDLRHVAQRLERLESAMVGGAGPACFGSAAAQLDQQQLFLAPDAVHYNPSDLAAWVDSMLSEISLSQSDSNDRVASHDPPPCQQVDELGEASAMESAFGSAEQMLQAGMQQPALPPAMALPPLVEEEDSGIRLVHILMTCAEAVQRGEVALAGALIEEMQPTLARVGTRFGIGKVAGYFIDALSRRLYSPPRSMAATATESEVLYHHFYEACPYLARSTCTVHDSCCCKFLEWTMACILFSSRRAALS